MKIDGSRLESNSRGRIAVNGTAIETTASHICAVGDIAGPPALASAAYVQGSYAVQHILDPHIEPHRLDIAAVARIARRARRC